jgi:hypothetical protein
LYAATDRAEIRSAARFAVEKANRQEGAVSEYQFVAFQAVDRPLTEKELEFARTQSSRAEITRWAFKPLARTKATESSAPTPHTWPSRTPPSTT